MAWPLSQDYNEAVQSPGLSFSDPELRAGAPRLNALGLPLPRSGNFADVYEFDGSGGVQWAVKCFTRQVPRQAERYAEISRSLRQARLPFTVDFRYLEQGIRVQGRWYPILKMQWVEGLLLNQFVRENLDRPARLRALLHIWTRMGRRLRDAGVAHCDLQHGNVLLVPGSTANSLALKLIDYDGLFVPALAAVPSGEVGHPAYQHPQRLRQATYSAEVDRFPLLVVATALRALLVGGRALWERYDNGDNLLFREGDFRAPGESPLFRELRLLRDPLTGHLADHLEAACAGTLEATPLLDELVPEERPAGAASASGIRTGSGAAVAEAPDWDFTHEAPARPVRRRRRRVPLWVSVGGGVAAGVFLLAGAVGAWLVTRGPDQAGRGPAVAQRKEVAAQAPVQPVRPEVQPAPEPAPPQRQDPVPVPPPDPGPPVQGPKDPARTAPEPVRPPERKNPEPALAELDLAPAAVHEIRQPFRFVPKVQGPFESTRVRRAKPIDVPVLEQPAWRIAVRVAVGDIALHPNGRHFVYSDFQGIIHLAELATGTVVRELKGHTGMVMSLAVSADGTRLLSGGRDHTARLWDLKTGAALHQFTRHTEEIRGVGLSADGKYALTRDFAFPRGPGLVCLWDTATGEQVASIKGTAHSASGGALFYPDNRQILLALGTYNQPIRLALWDPSGKGERPYLPLPLSQNTEPVRRMVLSGDGEELLVSCHDSLVLVHTRSARVLRRIVVETLTLGGLDLRADARYCLCSGGASRERKWFDCFAHVVSLKSGREVCRLDWPTGALNHALFTPDGRHVLTSAHREIMLWDLPGLK